MIRLFGVLVLVNVVLFMWPKPEVRSDGNSYPPRVNVNERLIRLNKEINEDQRSVTESVLPTEAPLGCFRLGPFTQSDSYDIAKATLLNADIEYLENRRAVQRSEVYRLYLGPFERRAEAVDARTTLTNQGVLDHFVRNEPEGGAIVSLGIYTTLETANLGQEQLSRQVNGVRLREEVVTLPQTDWLYFSLSGRADVYAQLQSVDWGEVGALLGPYACQN